MTTRSERIARLAAGAIAIAIVFAAGLAAEPVQAADAPWPIEADCAACHTKQAPGEAAADEAGADGEVHDAAGSAAADEAGEATSRTEASFQALHAGFGCATCHADAKLGELHTDVTADDKMPKRLKKSSIEKDLCLTCHDAEKLVEDAKGCEALTDDNGTVVNPHDLPDVADHDPITCIDCHVMHKDGDEPVGDVAKAKCISCHHENVFECGTCHN